MNKVILLGRLTKDPETRYSQAAEPVAITRYTLAVRKQFKRENEPDADFINCVAHSVFSGLMPPEKAASLLGKRGDFAAKYFKKGQQVAVVGRLSVREYEGQDGKRHWFTEVVADEQRFAESKGGGGQPYPPDEAYAPPDNNTLDEDDLPF
jgi:single-strand DNA-binding protein